MDVACDDRYHCTQVLGFFALRHGEVTSPQFTIISNVTQSACVVVSPIGGYDTSVRLVVVHQDTRRHGKVVGFTSERNEKLEYFYAGVIPFGRLLLIPVEGHDRITRPDYPYEDYVTVFEEVDGSWRYTRKAEDALEYLFEVLDADNNGFLSASEMSVFKEFLGLRHGITEDEWSDALFGWQDGDLDYTLTEMSLSFFKTFVLRLCQGCFTFSEPWTETPYQMSRHARRIRNLERIFECFGFDKDLVPGISRYSIRIYTERNSMSKFTVIPREWVTQEKAVKRITMMYGKKKSKHGLTIFTLQCPDWFSVLVKNCDVEPKEVVIECRVSTENIFLPKPGFSWKKVIPGNSEMVMSFLQMWVRSRIPSTAPVQNPPRAISTCTTLASSELAGRLSITRGTTEDLQIHCNVLHNTETDTLQHVSLM